jgi:ABC-type transporter Mla subunit MlaD
MYRSGVRQGIGLKEAQSRHAAEGAHGLAADFENQSERLQALESESEHLLQSLDRTGDMLEAARRDVRQVATAARDQLSAVDSAHASIGGLVAREQALSEQAAALQRILGGRSPVVREDLERMNRASLVTGFIAGVMSSIVAAGILGGFRSASSRIASLLRRRVG